MSEPYKITCTLQPKYTRQVGTAPDGVALAILIIGFDGPVALIEDGLHVHDYETMAAARLAAQLHYHSRATARGLDAAGRPLHHLQITWTTVP